MRPLLQEVAEIVRRETGIRLRENQELALESAIRRSAPGLDPVGFLRLAADPIRGPETLERLIDEVTVQETYFLRDESQLRAINWRLLLRSAQEAGAHTIRVWTAACATGEEAYTLAMLATEAFAPVSPPVTILATDVSRAALARAWVGRYRSRSVRVLPQPLLERHLTPHGAEFEVDERLRRLVRFEHHNLVRDSAPPLGEDRFDLIVCRNVLIYFDGQTVEHVIGSLESALRPQGTLVLGAADTLCGTAQRLSVAAPPPLPPESTRGLRAPLGRENDLMETALDAADAGRHADALAAVGRLLREQPLHADAYFVRGLVQLESGAAADAITSFRRALYVDPAFGLAAFKLGRAYDESGDEAAARRSYEQALRTLDPEAGRHERILAQVDLGDVAAACQTRLAAIGSTAR